MDHLSIETPEQVRLEFPLAGIGSRFLALALDTLIQLIAVLLVLLIGALVPSQAVSWPSSRAWSLALAVLLDFAVQFGYFAFFEAIWHGQTPGKRYCHLRVIKESGGPITPYDAAARNFLRIVDSLPGIYAVGIISALISSQSKRLGDYVAGTVVVHEEPLTDVFTAPAAKHNEAAAAPVRYLIPLPPRSAPVAAAPTFRSYDVGRLSVEEFQLIETFLLRRNQLDPVLRGQAAQQIVKRFAPKLEISPEEQANDEPLLEALANQYRSRAPSR